MYILIYPQDVYVGVIDGTITLDVSYIAFLSSTLTWDKNDYVKVEYWNTIGWILTDSIVRGGVCPLFGYKISVCVIICPYVQYFCVESECVFVLWLWTFRFVEAHSSVFTLHCGGRAMWWKLSEWAERCSHVMLDIFRRIPQGVSVIALTILCHFLSIIFTPVY